MISISPRRAWRRLSRFGSLSVGLIVAFAATPAHATAYTLGPGESMSLTADLVLQIGDSFTAQGTVASPCQLSGQGFGIKVVDGWQGTFSMSACNISGLGTEDVPALQITANGASSVTLQQNVFDASGAITVVAVDTASVSIVGNTILDTSLVTVDMTSFDNSVPAILLGGYGNLNTKLFQGNRIYRSFVRFQRTQNWLVGGDGPGDGNIIIGQRGGIFVESGHGMRIVGNYIHVLGPLDGWNQVKAFSAAGDSLLVEHNVMRGGNWLIDIAADIELRYNLFADSFDRPMLLLESSDTMEAVHHNLFIRTDPNVGMVSGAWVLHPQGMTKTEIYNNTFYGGGKCWQVVAEAIAVETNAFLDSLRSNAIVQFPVNLGDDTALIRGGGPERAPASGEPAYEPIAPPPPRLGYADYNLFDNPDAFRKDNYALSVANKQERLDPGFALNDQAVGGAVDQQLDAQFTGPIPIAFPYSDDDVKAGVATVCQILHFYRQIFTPAPGSPLIDTGDPQEGAGNDIGAVGAGVPNDQDLFGTLCAGGDIGNPDVSATAFTCPEVPPKNTPQSPSMPAPAPSGFICVCQAAGKPSAETVVSTLLVLLLYLWRRPGRALTRAK